MPTIFFRLWPYITKTRFLSLQLRSDNQVERLVMMENLLHEREMRITDLEKEVKRLDRHNTLLTRTLQREGKVTK